MKQSIPFSKPAGPAKANAVEELTDEQKTKYEQVLKYFQDDPQIPIKEKSHEKSPLTILEKAWLSKECFLRYLRASKWDVKTAKKRLEATLVWRRTFGVDPHTTLTSAMVEMENETGKEVVLGFDNDARPCLYLKPGRQNTKASHRQVQHVVYMLERLIEFMVPGQDQLALLIDFKPTSVGKHSKLPSLSTGREVLNILQDHYPARLGRALLPNIPQLAQLFIKLIYPFIDPFTREKIVFSEPFPNYVPKEQLDQDFGGSVEFDYDHKVYWPALVEMSDKRREYFLMRHKELGGHVGLSESELREGFFDKYPDDA